MRVLLITPGGQTSQHARPFIDALVEGEGVEVRSWSGGPWPAAGNADVAVSFVKYRHLQRARAIDWQGFDGLRVHYDWDALQDAHWSASPLAGTWATTLRLHRFDLAITSGLRSRDALREQGISAETVHKAADPAIRDLGGDRPDLYGMFGRDYPSRVLVKAELRRAGVPFTTFQAPFAELGAALNRFRGIITCTLDARLRLPLLGSRLYPWWPRHFVVTGTGPEPMLKLFEAAAAGAAPFVEWTPDLAHLGFVDGVNCIVYRTVPELVDRARHYGGRPDRLRVIGRAAGEHAARTGTWPHRAEAFRRVLEEWLRNG